MPRFDGPENLNHEGPIRALLETAFTALEGRVATADGCFERITRSEVWRQLDGRRGLVPFAIKSGLVMRLVSERGQRLEASLGDLSPMDVRMRLDEAVAVLNAQPEVATEPLAPVPHRDRRHFGASESLPEAATLALRWERLLDGIERIITMATPAGVTLSHHVRAYAQVEDKVIADPDGLWRTQCLPQVFVQVDLQAQREPARSRFVVRAGALSGLEALIRPDGELSPEVVRELKQGITRVLALLSARALTPEERRRLTHFVLDPSAMVFIHEACGHNFEADIIQQGGSGLFEASGAAVDAMLASPAVRLVDGPPIDAKGRLQHGVGFGTQLIDDEGIEVEPVILLDQGRIAHVLHNRETAGRFGTQSNGRGFSELGQPRLVRMTNTYLVPSDPSFLTQDRDTFLRGIQLGLWLEGSHGGQVSGDGMSTTIQIARVIRDGVLTDEWLLPCTLSVQTRGALKTVERFFGEPVIDRPGFCGKGQMKTVTVGGYATRLSATEAISVAW